MLRDSVAMCGQELEQMSSVDQGSQYSLSDGILPSLGAASRNHRRPKLRRFIISPFNPRYKSLSLCLSRLLGFVHQCVLSNGLMSFLFVSAFWMCRLWQSFLILWVFYTAWVCPFEFGFLDSPRGPLAITDNVVNGLFGIDIILTFFVAYLDKTTYLLIDSPKLIALRYAKTWLAFDIISIIPSEFAQTVLPHPLANYGYFNILRLWRLRRVSAMFAR